MSAAEEVDVSNSAVGKLFVRQLSDIRRRTAANSPIIQIRHRHSTTALSQRNIPFLHVDFDVNGDRFAAVDYHGNLYNFNITLNQFKLLSKTGTPSTAINFKTRRHNEVLVAQSDDVLRCYNTDDGSLVGEMKGLSSIVNINVHTSGRYAITTTFDNAMLWDLESFERRRKLNIKGEIGIVKVFFLPLSNKIITCFKDDTVMLWDAENFTFRNQLPQPNTDTLGYKSFSCSR